MKTQNELISKVSDIEEDETRRNEERGVRIAASRMTDMFDKTQQAMAAALKLASLCYNSQEIKRLASLDKYGCDWMNDISEGMCALSRIDTNMKERLILSIKMCPQLYDALCMDERISELDIN